MPLNLTDLKESNDFLNVLLENINSAVMIVDPDFRIREFNDALARIFGGSGKKLRGGACGEALGCIFAVVERAHCGATTHCRGCGLRKTIANTFRKKASSKRRKLSRVFYRDEAPVQKHLEYSTRFICFNGQEYALLIINDITESETRRLELIRKQRQIEADLKAAASIQRALLPSRRGGLRGVRASWRFLPCSTIGGDIFNLLPLGDGRTGCYIMDASGHGVRSALVAVSVSQLLQPASSRLPLGFPAALCKALDRRFPLERFNTFFSMLYMVLDPKAGTLTWCNAGHPPAVLVRTGGEMELLHAGGPIIGLGGMLPFNEGIERVSAGNRIYLCTDGLIERRNRSGRLFGMEGLLDSIARFRNESLSQSVSSLAQAAMDHGEGLDVADDISLLGLEIQ